MMRFGILGLSALALVVVAAIQREPVLVGVLEQPQCLEGAPVAARPLFVKTASGWTALTNPTASRTTQRTGRTWTVAFDGRNLGPLASVDTGFRGQPDWTYARDHVELVADGQSVPRIPNGAKAFGGWCDTPPVRPLLLVSQPNFVDPERWRPFQPGDTYRRAVFARFRAAIGDVFVCPGGSWDEETPWRYAPNDLVYAKSYGDSLGRKLVAVRLNPAARNCPDDPGPKWSVHWFFVGRDTIHLGTDLELVDAGDYDADGQSEVIFWHSADKQDGYSLFFDQFRQHADFRWQYYNPRDSSPEAYPSCRRERLAPAIDRLVAPFLLQLAEVYRTGDFFRPPYDSAFSRLLRWRTPEQLEAMIAVGEGYAVGADNSEELEGAFSAAGQHANSLVLRYLCCRPLTSVEAELTDGMKIRAPCDSVLSGLRSRSAR